MPSWFDIIQNNPYLKGIQLDSSGKVININNSIAPKSSITSNVKGQEVQSGNGGDIGSNIAKASEIANTFTSPITQAMHYNSKYSSDDNANLQNNIRTGFSDMAIQSKNPIAMAIGLGAKFIDAGLDATGLRSSNITKEDADKIGISNAGRIWNNANNFLPGNFLAIGGSKLNNSEMSLETSNSSGYRGTVSDIKAAQKYGGNRVNFLLGSRNNNKINNLITEQNRRNKLITDAIQTNTLRKESTYSQDLSNQNINKLNGMKPGIQIGKKGLKLQNGGSILIPKGALHARKHHMDEVNPELAEELTKKGIPIITTDGKGNVEQVAEAEKEEIILEKSLTDKIESLWKKGDEESMIKAGKLIVDTLFNNCDDNVNLIKNTK